MSIRAEFDLREAPAHEIMTWARKVRSEAEALRSEAEVACADTHNTEYLSGPLGGLILSLETLAERAEHMVAMRTSSDT